MPSKGNIDFLKNTKSNLINIENNFFYVNDFNDPYISNVSVSIISGQFLKCRDNYAKEISKEFFISNVNKELNLTPLKGKEFVFHNKKYRVAEITPDVIYAHEINETGETVK